MLSSNKEGTNNLAPTEAPGFTALIRKARRYPDKQSFILPRVTNRNVLDIGCADYDRSDRTDAWLHGEICRVARRAIGIDIQRERVEQLNSRGYSIEHADAETMKLGDTFDVIVAGDVIEHLSNPGRFLDRVREHLAPGGECIITTPTSVSFLRICELLFQRYAWAHPEHTTWFSEIVITELARRSNLELTEIAYIDDAYLHYEWSSWWFWPRLIDVPLCRLWPRFSETFAVVFKCADPPS